MGDPITDTKLIRRMTPLGAALRGAIAGAAGTAAMDTLLYWRYRHEGRTAGPLEWEFADGLESWEDAPAPAQVGRRLAEGFLQRALPASNAQSVTNIVHWGYGMAWGSLFGVVAGGMPRRSILLGLPLGAVVWSSSYVTLPLAGLYKPIWEYDSVTLAKDLSAHLVYGAIAALAFETLAPRR